MRVKKLVILLLFCGRVLSAYSQLYFPNERFYTNEIDRLYLKDSSLQTYYNSHRSMRPIRESRTNTDSLYFKDSKHYTWIGQKLFKENFLIFEGEDFWCAVDPIVDYTGGTDFNADSIDYLYWNTRGVRVQGKFLDKVAFSTVVYENQAILPKYIADYAQDHGELRIIGFGYSQVNAIIPGYARSKWFKMFGYGYDFAFAEGTVSIAPNKHFNIQFGNGNQFIGNGYRSLLLSDFATNYPFAKFEGNFLKGRLQYTAIYSIHQNLARIRNSSTVEPIYERKIGTHHYLDFALTPKINIGLFEGAVWRRVDSLGSVEPNWLFTNPVPLVNAAIMANETDGYNHILGLNFSWAFLSNQFYGQLVLDEGKIRAYQVGIKSYDLLLNGFDLQFEFNHAEQMTYFAEQRRYNYSHNNLPLAHPLTSGFTEGVLTLKYEYRSMFIRNQTNLYTQKVNDTMPNSSDIVFANLNFMNAPTETRNVLINNLEAGYRFNKHYNLQGVIGWTYRNEQRPGSRHLTNYIYAGIRTRLRNKTQDF